MKTGVAVLKRFTRSRIYINAYALVLNQVISAGLGFVYWMLAARLYGVGVVGASSAAISTLLLVSGITQMGLGGGMNRFVPRAGAQTRRLIVGGYIATIVAAGTLGLAALLLLRSGVIGDIPELSYFTPTLAVLATILWSVFTFQDGVLMGLRKSVWVLIENTTYNVSKIAALVIGALFLKESGIVASWFLPTPFVVALVAWIVFARVLREPIPPLTGGVKPPTIKEVASSVTGDHFGNVISESAVRALPIVVVALLGTAQNAYFYQAWMIANALTLMASGMANSFSAEAAGDRRNITAYSWGILRHMAVMMVPATLVAGIGASIVLSLFGPAYAREGAALLRLLAVATLPAAFVVWYLAYARVVGRIREVFALQTLRGVFFLGMSYVLLPSFGIESIGVAWLVVNVVAAAWGVFDARDALWPTEGTAGGQPSHARILQRGDWRFLLPDPRPKKVALFTGGMIAESAKEYATHVVDGRLEEARECDVAVATKPDAETLRACHESLIPGGACYSEWPAWGPFSPRAVRTRLQDAGFADVRLYWPMPRATTVRVWVPLGVPAGLLAGPLRRIARNHYQSPVLRVATSVVARVALEAGPFPTMCAVALKPPSEPTGAVSEGCVPLLTKHLYSPTGEQEGHGFVVMRSGRGITGSKVNWLLYEGRPARLSRVAKSARSASAADRLRREYRALQALERRGLADTGVTVPRCECWTDDDVSPFHVQTALAGESLGTKLRRLSYDTVAVRLTQMLVELAGEPRRVPKSLWWERLVERRLRALDEHVGEVLEPELIPAIRDCLSGLDDLPLIWTHNDCAPWNIVVADDKLAMFDWELANPLGLPAVDLVYGLATSAFMQDRVAATPRAIETYERLLKSTDPRGMVFQSSLDDYADAMGLSDEDISRLRVAAWVGHAANEAKHLVAGVDELDSEVLESSVILPILRRDLAEYQARPSTEGSTSTPEKVLVLSPHLDDAVISCGAGIKHLVDRGTDVTVVNVCTADEEEGAKMSPLARRTLRGWGLPWTKAFALRQDEDAQAMALVGATPVYLGLKDAVFRRTGEGGFAYSKTVCQTPEPSDANEFVGLLYERLMPLLNESPDAVILCPAGVGGHVDHLLVRNFVESACDTSRIVFYEEYPYSKRSGLGRSQDFMTDMGCCPFVLYPSATELRARIESALCYRSQLRGLFPTVGQRLAEIVSARIPFMRWVSAGRTDRPVTLRRVRSMIAQDVEREGGEIYWLSEHARSPFARPSSRS